MGTNPDRDDPQRGDGDRHQLGLRRIHRRRALVAMLE